MTLLYTHSQGNKPITRPTKQTNYSNAFSVFQGNGLAFDALSNSADTVILKGRARQTRMKHCRNFGLFQDRIVIGNYVREL